ncbi:MAG: hypothetical protein ACO3YZ_04645 [Candidatus Nanopelagicaceae bacterium]
MSKVLYVKNRGVTFSSSFKGVEYVFECNKEIEVPEAAVKHILGLGDENKQPYFVRLGWMKMNTDLPRALERLKAVDISDEPEKKVHLSAPVVERVATPMPKVPPKGKSVAKVHQQLQ